MPMAMILPRMASGSAAVPRIRWMASTAHSRGTSEVATEVS